MNEHTLVDENQKVSVVIPSYNCAKLIGRAIESVLCQDYQNKELIVVDGNSTDGTVEIICNYAQQHLCVKWLTEPDEGVYDAMNKGIAMSEGEWIYFLGADDTLYDANVISRVLSSVDRDCQVVYGNVLSARFEGKYDGEFDLEKILQRNICHQAIFYRKQLFESLGGYSLRYRVLADYEFNLRWMLAPNTKHHFIDVVVANYGSEGISSVNPVDSAFNRDFSWLVLKYGRKTLPKNVLRQRVLWACCDLIDQGRLLGSLVLFVKSVFLLRSYPGYYELVYLKYLLKSTLKNTGLLAGATFLGLVASDLVS